MKNTCVNCQDSWKVNTPAHQLTLDTTDQSNLSTHGQLFSLCEDCNEGECVSVLV